MFIGRAIRGGSTDPIRGGSDRREHFSAKTNLAAMARIFGLQPTKTLEERPFPTCPSTPGRAIMFPGTVRSSAASVRTDGAEMTRA